MATLSSPGIARKTIKAFKSQFPFIMRTGIDFSAQPLKLNKQVIAHIRTLPTMQKYDRNNGGYKNGAQSARGLLHDVPIIVDEHNHVPLEWQHLDMIKDQKDTYEGAMNDAGFVLGRGMTHSILSKVRGSSISREKIVAAANVESETLSDIQTEMNIAKASPHGRIGLVNSYVANSLSNDTRIASKDYYGIENAGQAYRVFKNVSGFQAIYEYPELDDNNKEGQTFARTSGNILTAVGHGYLTGDRVRVTTTDTDLPAGLAVDTTYRVIRLSADTFSLATTDANASAGTAIALADAGTGTHTVVGWENLQGFFFEPSAVGIVAGVPADTSRYAAAMGIPMTTGYELVTDPESGFSLMMLKWHESGLEDLYVSPTALWGSVIGRQGSATSEMTDRGGYRLVGA